jgi:hypothetical protein
MWSPRWVVELGKHQHEPGLRQPVPTQPTSKTVDRPPGAAPRPPPSPVTCPPTPHGGHAGPTVRSPARLQRSARPADPGTRASEPRVGQSISVIDRRNGSGDQRRLRDGGLALQWRHQPVHRVRGWPIRARRRQNQPEPALRLHRTPLRSRHGTPHVSECPANRDAIAHRSQGCAGRTRKGC